MKYTKENLYLCSSDCPYKKFRGSDGNLYDPKGHSEAGHHVCTKFTGVEIRLERALAGTNYNFSILNCEGKTLVNFLWDENPLMLRQKISVYLQEIQDATDKMYSYIKEFYPNLNIEHELGDMFCECKASPFRTCLYNKFEDPAQDSCIFCGEPNERK